MQKFYTLTFYLFLTVTLVCCSQAKTHNNPTDHIEVLYQSTCLAPFETFSKGGLYYEDKLNYARQNYTGLTEPWSVQASIPNGSAGYLHFIRYADSKAERDNTEIWVESFDSEEFYIYLLELDSWETVSQRVIGTNKIVDEIFLANDGTIWGRTYWTFDNEITLLSRLNEETKRFESVQEFYKGRLLELDSNGVFWLLVDGDGLYTYDTGSDVFERVIDFPQTLAEKMATTDQGDIYFVVVDREDTGQNWETLFPHLHSGSFLRFSNELSQLEEVPLPEEPWPRRGGTLYVAGNQLWIDDVGYFDLETDTWHSRDSDLSDYFAGNASWASPELKLIDSYGIYWFALVRDPPSVGMAWYDPTSDNGCMFTTSISTNIVEDLNHNLWMSLDGNLYVWRRGNQ